MGVFLLCRLSLSRRRCLPHVRGGVSLSSPFKSLCKLSSPRSWGCFLYWSLVPYPLLVFPTFVGVFLSNCLSDKDHFSLPHVRGGVSSPLSSSSSSISSSPRSWGCFCGGKGAVCPWRVFPTSVGVFLYLKQLNSTNGGLPHVCGGVSRPYVRKVSQYKSSPRLWGCFYVVYGKT